jgi:phosphoribosylamine---glycine ligase
VTALGNSVTEAQGKAYEQVRQIHWDGVYYRTDIGHRAVHRENSISPPG